MTQEQKGRFLKAFLDIRRSFQQFSAVESLTQGEFLVLRRIKIEQETNSDNLGIFKAVKISEYLLMPPPAVSRIFNSLESKGLIERKINQENRRSVVVSLSKSGEETLEKSQKSVDSFFDKLIGSLGEEDSLKLLTLLEKALAAISEGE